MAQRSIELRCICCATQQQQTRYHVLAWANDRGERRFFSGEVDEVHYTFRDAEHLLSTLERYLPLLQSGERFLLKFGEKYITLSLENFSPISFA